MVSKKGAIRLAFSSSSSRLTKISRLTTLSAISLLLYFTLIVASDILRINLRISLSIWELIHIILHVIVLNTHDLTLLPLPQDTNQLTPKWLTTALHENGIVPSDQKVIAFSNQETLTGGCHFSVSRIKVEYSPEGKTVKSSLPQYYVVKILSWNYSLFRKLMLLYQKANASNTIHAMYLRSYEIEHRFYKYVGHKHYSGLKAPLCYYNFEDSFNNKFGMIMEDLQGHEDGQPNGFCWVDSIACLNHLAKFHSTNWNHPPLHRKMRWWNVGGYWTGDKREADKTKIVTSWEQTLINFEGLIELGDGWEHLGREVESVLPQIIASIDNMEPRTLVHGDYKISNLFMDRPKDGPSSTKPSPVFAIDWQWLGSGSAAIDCFYFIITSVQSQYLIKQRELLQIYFAELLRQLDKHHIVSHPDFTFDDFWAHYQICVVDFFSYVVCAKWANMTIDDFGKYQALRKDGLHLRSVPHMQHLINCTADFLPQLKLSLLKNIARET